MRLNTTILLATLLAVPACTPHDDPPPADTAPLTDLTPRNNLIGVELSINLNPTEYGGVLSKCLPKDESIIVTYDNWLSEEGPNAFLVLDARFLTAKASADCIRGKLLDDLGGELTPVGTTGDESTG